MKNQKIPKKKSRNRLFKNWMILIIVVIVSIVLASYYKYKLLGQNSQILQVTEIGGKVNLAFDKPNLQIAPGKSEITSLYMNTYDQKVTGVDIEILYDPNVIEPPIVTQGTFLSKSLQNPTISDGKIRFIYLADPTTGGVAGKNMIASFTIKLKPGAVKESKLSITSNTKIAAIGYPKNVLKEAYDVSISPLQPSVMYYFNTSTKQCVATNSPYSNPEDCVGNLKVYAPGMTSEKCYTSQSICNSDSGI